MSLLDVVDLAFPDLLLAARELGDMFYQCLERRGQPVTLADKDVLLPRLEKIRDFAEGLELDATYGAATVFIDRLNNAAMDFMNHGEVADRLTTIRSNLEFQLASKRIGFVPKDKVKYWQAENLFGEEVARKFEGAKTDLEEAGNCFAMGRYTACVFHLMRVMEVGLLRLAKRLHVGGARQQPWGITIGKIEDKLRGSSKKKSAQKYGDTVAYFRMAKNGWRDRVCHSNVSYEEGEAKATFSATEGFMRGLAEVF